MFEVLEVELIVLLKSVAEGVKVVDFDQLIGWVLCIDVI